MWYLESPIASKWYSQAVRWQSHGHSLLQQVFRQGGHLWPSFKSLVVTYFNMGCLKDCISQYESAWILRSSEEGQGSHGHMCQYHQRQDSQVTKWRRGWGPSSLSSLMKFQLCILIQNHACQNCLFHTTTKSTATLSFFFPPAHPMLSNCSYGRLLTLLLKLRKVKLALFPAAQLPTGSPPPPSLYWSLATNWLTRKIHLIVCFVLLLLFLNSIHRVLLTRCDCLLWAL